jgi:Uma2 family endonuclease
MMQVVTVPESAAPVTLRWARERFTDEAYYDFCMANPGVNIERTADGAIVIVPPAGPESSYRNAKVTAQLDAWAAEDGRGKSFDSSVEFFLPDGSALSPDASWISNESLSRFTRQELKKFLHCSPEFIVEVRSPSDSLSAAKAKMERWISNGVQLAWLIAGDAKTVYVYRKGRAMRPRRGVTELRGEGPVRGFVLDLTAIWKGL